MRKRVTTKTRPPLPKLPVIAPFLIGVLLLNSWPLSLQAEVTDILVVQVELLRRQKQQLRDFRSILSVRVEMKLDLLLLNNELTC